ncbi:MAG: hypothetical protein JOZ58_03465 [Acetobacteraceae bacterium]|nr:hypothetical protein [Acetobacteraceae bacterium]
MVAAGFKFQWGWHYVGKALAGNGRYLLDGVGPLATAFGLAGLLAASWRPMLRGESHLPVCAAAMVLSVWIFQCVVPSGIQDRYLIPLLPPFLMLAGWALLGVADFVLRLGGAGLSARRAMPALGLLAIAIPVLVLAPDPMAKPRNGLTAAAREAWSHVTVRNPSVLVAAQGLAEPAGIAELALRDPARPSLFAVRGSRLLGAGGFQDYEPRYGSAAAAMAAIDEYAIPLVILRTDGAPGEWAHLRQIEDAIALFPERWELLWRDDTVRPIVSLYRVQGNERRAADLSKLVALSGPRAMAGYDSP